MLLHYMHSYYSHCQAQSYATSNRKHGLDLIWANPNNLDNAASGVFVVGTSSLCIGTWRNRLTRLVED